MPQTPPEIRAGDKFAIICDGAVSRQGAEFVETRLQLTYAVRQSTPEEVIELESVQDLGPK